MKKYRSLLAILLAGTMTISTAMPTMANDEQLTQTFEFEKPALLETVSNSNQSSSKSETVFVSLINSDNRSQNFNEHWRFYLGEANGAEVPTYNDSEWRDVNLPHDYSIEQNYTSAGEAESGYLLGGTGWYRKSFILPESMKGKKVSIDFDGAYMNATVWLNGTKLGTHPYGYTSFAFELPAENLNFNGENVIAVQTVNKIPSSRWYSGSGIYRDVHLTVTEPIHVARYGTTITTPNLETEKGGNVTVNVSTKVENQGTDTANVTLRHNIYKSGSNTSVGTATTSAKTIAAGTVQDINSTMFVNNPTLWEVKKGGMYYVRTELLVDGLVCDSYDTDFGFRYFNFDSNTGFSLNGENMKLKGVCMHHDQGALGAEAWYRAIERQVETLQEMGCNSIRVTHNPAADILIEICNKKGMLVIDEAFDTWLYPKNGNSNDYSVWIQKEIETDNTIIGGEPGTMTWGEFDLKTMVERGNNAPSIIMWSLGNEIFEGISGNASSYPTVAQDMITWVNEIDTTRPITFGDNKLKNNHTQAIAIANQLKDIGGTIGYNYTTNNTLDAQHTTYPDWLMYGAETASSVNSRGVYDRKGSQSDKNNDRLLTSYDKSAVGWGARASDAWYDTITNDYYAGEYVWTGFDYIGEPTPWNGTGSGTVGGIWDVAPKSSYFGIIDTAGFPKDSFYFYQSQWNEDVHTLNILPTWNENEIMKDSNGNVEVVVYSDAAKVKLEHIDTANNVTDLGTKEFTKVNTYAGYSYQIYQGSGASGTAHENLYLTWNVPFREGTLKATAYDSVGNIITSTEGRSSVTTTGAPSKLVAKADRNNIDADGKDLSYITIDVQDAAGNFVNGANPTIQLTIQGDGVIVGVDNGSQPDHTSYQSLTRKAFNGKLLAIVQSTKQGGSFTLTASANGLSSSSVRVNTNSLPGGERELQSYEMSRNYYVKVGTSLVLPESIQVKYNDGSTAKLNVIWEPITDESLSQVGNFMVKGTVEGTSLIVSVNVNVLDTVGALLNYSTGVSLGANIVLPPSRPAILADGTIISAEFPVNWDTIPANASQQPGIIKVNGVANVFGKAIAVTATIRVAEEEVTLDGNVEDNAVGLNSSINSGDIEKIRDSNITDNGWTGYGDISFRYDTAQNLGQVKLYFAGDAPAQDKVELLWSPEGSTWNSIYAQGVDTNYANGTLRTYTFDLVPAVWFKLNFGEEVSLAELELIVGTSAFSLNSSDELTAMTVNGQTVDSYSLQQRRFSTPAYFVKDFEAESEKNAAYTLLPIYQDMARVITESEDHTKHGVYTILLRSRPEAGDPSDSSRDYDYNKTTATAASQENRPGNEGPVILAIDNDPATYWHTAWGENLKENLEKRYIQLELEEETLIDSLRYLPRPSIQNGVITRYRVDVSSDNVTWKTVSQGDWELNTKWKIALFDESVMTKFVRLYGVTTYGDGAQGNQFVSAAEVRVCTAPVPGEDISSAIITIVGSFEYNGSPIEPVPTVIFNGTELEYGIDYTVTYKDNVLPGTATLIIEGIGNYSGTASNTFIIIQGAIDPDKELIKGKVSIEGTATLGSVLTLNKSELIPENATGIVTWVRGNDSISNTTGSAIIYSSTTDSALTLVNSNLNTIFDTAQSSYIVVQSSSSNEGDTYTIVKKDLGKTLTAIFTANGDYTGSLLAEKKIPAVVPDAPALTSVVARDSNIIMEWEAPFDGGSPITGYEITVNGATDSPYVVSAESTSYGVAGLTNGKEYIVSMVANNAVGTGTVSNIEKVTPKQSDTYYTITFDSNGGNWIPSMVVKEGNTATLATPTRNDGYRFVGWFTALSGGMQFTNNIPIRNNITLYAQWKKIEDSAGSSSGSTESNTSNPVSGEPVVGESKPVQTDDNGNVTFNSSLIIDAITKAQNEAKKNGTEQNGLAIKIPVTTTNDQVSLNITIESKPLERMISENVKYIDIITDNMISYRFNNDVLKQMKTQSNNSDIIIRGDSKVMLSTEARAVIGTRPVYDIQIIYLSKGKEVPISDFDGKTVSIKLLYIPAVNEQTDNLYAVYVDNSGKVNWIDNSHYDSNEKAIIFDTNHFSVYGVGYKLSTPTISVPVFYDIATHWAKDDIEFVAAIGLLSGTAANTFSPNISMTRGMFVTALGRLSKVDVSAYTSSGFIDVKPDAYYMGYVEWANKEGIVSGIGNGKFAPDQPVTRQEMSVILANYAKSMKYTISETQLMNTFTDSNSISNWANNAVRVMQMAGILSGRDDGSFDPKGTATRAEVAAVLHRFIERVIDLQIDEK